MIGTLHRHGALRLAAGLAALACYLTFGLLPTSSSAATVSATQTQSLQAEINPQVSWGSNSGCTQNIQTNDFGALTPNAFGATAGSFDALPHTSASTDAGSHSVWVGCVTTNTGLQSVTAQGTANMTDGHGDTLPLSTVTIGTTNTPTGSTCNITANASLPGTCVLPVDGTTSRTLVAGAARGTTELDWQLALNLPANQPTGNYSGGQITFTATV
jgi:hypothetical protein